MITSEIFDVTDQAQIDNGIQRYEYQGHSPKANIDLNTPGELVIEIDTKDKFRHPSECYLHTEGRLMKNKKDGVESLREDAAATLANNGFMYLFDWIKLSLSDMDVEYVNNLGQATTMLGLLKYPRKFPQGIYQLWCILILKIHKLQRIMDIRRDIIMS